MSEDTEKTSSEPTVSDDFSQTYTSARIACYDDMMSAPRVTVIPPGPTNKFIEEVTTTTYTQAQQAGGTIPYSAIREVSENFIHARFKEIVVSILDHGRTIRFADQGPGIPEKEKALKPGYTSATEPMTQYIRGVGSGFPLVKEYLTFTHGHITIDDNLKHGTVITLSVVPEEEQQKDTRSSSVPTPALSEKERTIFSLFVHQDTWRITDITEATGMSSSTVYRLLGKLQEYGLIELLGKQRTITDYGRQVAAALF